VQLCHYTGERRRQRRLAMVHVTDGSDVHVRLRPLEPLLRHDRDLLSESTFTLAGGLATTCHGDAAGFSRAGEPRGTRPRYPRARRRRCDDRSRRIEQCRWCDSGTRLSYSSDQSVVFKNEKPPPAGPKGALCVRAASNGAQTLGTALPSRLGQAFRSIEPCGDEAHNDQSLKRTWFEVKAATLCSSPMCAVRAQHDPLGKTPGPAKRSRAPWRGDCCSE
jgi:hypothetical protein